MLCSQVSYFYDASLGDFYYGPTHPMKPHRVRMAHDLIVRYDLYKHLQVCWHAVAAGACSAGMHLQQLQQEQKQHNCTGSCKPFACEALSLVSCHQKWLREVLMQLQYCQLGHEFERPALCCVENNM